MAALPTFLVIGADKCGTTSLHHYLGEHPEVQVSWPKELHFFTGQDDPALLPPDPWPPTPYGAGHWERGVDWYRSHFDPSYAVRGESTPDYTAPWYPEAPRRLAAVVPDARLIYCVRDPVRRALSSYTFRRAMGTDPRPPQEALRPDGWYAARSRYSRCLAQYLERFPRERILVVEAELLDAERRATLRRVFSFLGVQDDYWSAAFELRWNVTAARSGVRWAAVRRLRRMPGWSTLTRAVPRRGIGLAERATRRGAPATAPALPPVPSAFVESLREDAARFRAAVDHDFPNWSV